MVKTELANQDAQRGMSLLLSTPNSCTASSRAQRLQAGVWNVSTQAPKDRSEELGRSGYMAPSLRGAAAARASCQTELTGIP